MNKKFVKLIIGHWLLFGILGIWLLVIPSPVNAVICNPVLKDCSGSVVPTTYVNNVIAAIISISFIVATLYFFWHIIFAGYHLMGSDGDPKKLESGKNEMTYSFLGLIVVFSIFGIIKFVGTVLGITNLENLSITWPTL